jgi:hypothetical protein
MKALRATALTAIALNIAAQPLPQVATGRIERLADFPSRHVAPRMFEGTGHNERDWAARAQQPLAQVLTPR